MDIETLTKKLRRIEIRSRKDATDVLAGDFKSAFRGAGIEFDEVREYMPGDDVRSIDWNVTARQGKPFIKRFQEERELTVFFLVDCSASGNYGAGDTCLNDLSAELCATLAFSAIKSNDKVGLALFTDHVERFIPPAKGATHAMRLIREVLGYKPQSTGTNLPEALEFLARALKKRAVIFLISDFQNAGDFERQMSLLAGKHDLVVLPLRDPSIETLPDAGIVEMQDAESGERFLVDTSSRAVRDAYAQRVRQQNEMLSARLKRLGIDNLPLSLGDECTRTLSAFLKRRTQRRR
ncbi:MAG: DUF58 domain-containing protein [Lentisphaeria bacterium]|nr:DUF58 domain-containing protein [Lentisphaeria bacterium]